MLPNGWIVFLGFHLLRMQTLILGHSVVVA